jgi:hypothetical protein
LALSESLSVVSEVKNAVSAIKMRCFREKMHSVLSKNIGYYQLLKISKVFNGESPIDQCIEHLTLTDILIIKYRPVISYDVEFSQNIGTYLPTIGGNFCFKM